MELKERWSSKTPIFWYIKYDYSLDVVLGMPIDFEVTIPPIN